MQALLIIISSIVAIQTVALHFVTAFIKGKAAYILEYVNIGLHIVLIPLFLLLNLALEVVALFFMISLALHLVLARAREAWAARGEGKR